jgi:hypothetical protein
MASKTGKTVNLKSIEEHLRGQDKKFELQDKKMIQSPWWSFAATVGVPIFLVGLVGLVGSWGVRTASNPNIAIIYWSIVAFIGITAISVGVCMVVKVSRRNSTTTKK